MKAKLVDVTQVGHGSFVSRVSYPFWTSEMVAVRYADRLREREREESLATEICVESLGESWRSE